MTFNKNRFIDNYSVDYKNTTEINALLFSIQGAQKLSNFKSWNVSDPVEVWNGTLENALSTVHD